MLLRTGLVLIGLVTAGVALADTPSKPARIDIKLTSRGFDPDNISVPAKQPVTLVFTRKTESTCTKSIVVTLDDGKKLERQLPLDKPVELAVTFPKAGKLTYACSMDMYKGTIVVQ